MSYQQMVFRLVGEIPGLPFPLAQTYINQALEDIYDRIQWSFQLAESGWLTPGLQFASGNQSAGTITTVAYSDQVVGDATASAAWLAYLTAGTLPLITQFQIRSPYYSLYSIVAYDGISTLTLDRPWMEPAGVGQAYMTYEAYFAAPVSDFKRFFTIRDTRDNAPIDFWTLSQTDLMVMDAQRTAFNLPAYCVPYEIDARVGSPTLGYPLFELWPHPLSVLPYTFAYLRRGPALSAPTDTLSPPLTEELVLWRAKEIAYLWKESQKGDGIARGAGADWRFLSEAAAAEYGKKFKVVSDRDRDMFELYFHRYVRGAAMSSYGLPFATINGGLNVGR